MPRSKLVWGGLGLVLLLLLSAGGFGAWLWRLPAATPSAQAPEVPPQEAQALLAALQPPRPRPGGRPLVAVLGLNDATETTDYLLPTGILRRADVAEVLMLATGPGRVRLYPALQVEPDATVSAFDAAHPEGADYVIVPAMSRDDDPAVLAWIRAQAAKGATIVSVCAGAKVVAAAGLLAGRRATTHWYYLPALHEREPGVRYVPDRRMVVDGGVVTTTGISASMPLMLTLVEAIAGRAKAQAVAEDLGLARWDARHASAAFRLTRPFATTVLANRAAFWTHETLGLRLDPGVDEVTLALAADAWSRTYRSRALGLAAAVAPVTSRHGVRLIPDRSGEGWADERRVPLFADRRPVEVLDRTLGAIGARYGERTADVVAMQLEYPRPAGPRAGRTQAAAVAGRRS